MEISAKVLADSINSRGIRITTMELHYHRYILPEFNTHRAFSRNGASSRAIPTKRLIELCLEELVEPLEWGLNQSGMQAFTIADEALAAEGRAIWNAAREDAVRHAVALSEKGFAKQIVNRVLEPYLSTRTVVTATDWRNFDTLRDHPDAQPEIRDLARKMIVARNASSPRFLLSGEWHTPYILDEDIERFGLWVSGSDILDEIKPLIPEWSTWFNTSADMLRVMVSAARCARGSYRTHEGKQTDFRDDLALFKRLVETQPVHASPTEHQATPLPLTVKSELTANYRGFVPFRRLIVGETVHG